MPPPQITSIGPLAPALDRIASGLGSEHARPDQRETRRFHEGNPLLLAGRKREMERTSRSRAALSDSAENILSARQFEYFLERERSLADRGTRRFTLLVLRRQASERGDRRGRVALTELAQQACKRLRSTDLVGRLDADRVEILLTDTEPAGAQAVAAWVHQVEGRLGLDLEQTIYVYPSVAEQSTNREPDLDPHERGPDEGMRSNGHGNGRLTRHSDAAGNTHVPSLPEYRVATNGKAVAGHLNGHALPRALDTSGRTGRVVSHPLWKMEDLWPVLGVPTPLWKRSLDILLSALALLLLFPLFALIALAIRLDSPGPVIFKHLRAGRGARPFVFYKFRSMIADAEEERAALAAQNEQDGPIFKIREDPRITRVGRWLRRWSMDELPQLWNVLKGDISLVGPRSPTFDEVCKYERWQLRRLSVTGGITCIWQVSGRSLIPFQEWMRLDMRYVASRNLWLDLRLLVQTVSAVLSGRGAC